MRENGGGSEPLAPVIPLFGGSAPSSRDDRRPSESESAEENRGRTTDGSGIWRSTWHASDAPARAAQADDDARRPSERHPAGSAGRAASGRAAEGTATRLRALRPHPDMTASGGREGAPTGAADPDEVRSAGEELLVRKLRTRSLSVSEARLVLKGHEFKGERLDAAQVDDVIDDFCRRGYLDDAVLAGHLVTSGVERKGQGRVALSRALAQRGIPRDVIETALDELPDDDAERALEFARTKARALSRLDGDTALRRLVGQLSRRGYNGSVAMTAAKAALAEASFGGSTSGVRFVDSD